MKYIISAIATLQTVKSYPSRDHLAAREHELMPSHQCQVDEDCPSSDFCADDKTCQSSGGGVFSFFQKCQMI